MGQQCGCFSDPAPRKLMHGTRVSAGKEKVHATAPFLVHEIPGIGIGDGRVALPGRAEYLAGTIPAAEDVRTGEVGKAMRDRRLQYYEYDTRIVVVGNSGPEARAVAEEIALTGCSNSSFSAERIRNSSVPSSFLNANHPLPILTA